MIIFNFAIFLSGQKYNYPFLGEKYFFGHVTGQGSIFFLGLLESILMVEWIGKYLYFVPNLKIMLAPCAGPRCPGHGSQITQHISLLTLDSYRNPKKSSKKVLPIIIGAILGAHIRLRVM